MSDNKQRRARDSQRSEPDYDPDLERPLGEDDERLIPRDDEPLAEVELSADPTPPSDGPDPPAQERDPSEAPDGLWGDPLEQSSRR